MIGSLRRCLPALAALFLMLAVDGCSEAVAPLEIKGSRFTIDNKLLSPIAVTINGVDIGTVDASQVKTIQRGDLASAVVDWRLVQPTIDSKAAGDSMAGYWTLDLPGDDDVKSLTVDHVVGSDPNVEYFFAPLITNQTGIPIVIGVNMGTDAERRLGGTLAPGETRRFIGYYRLGLNSNVRAYSTGAAFSPLLFVEKSYGPDFKLADLEPESGSMQIVFDQPPPAILRSDAPSR